MRQQQGLVGQPKKKKVDQQDFVDIFVYEEEPWYIPENGLDITKCKYDKKQNILYITESYLKINNIIKVEDWHNNGFDSRSRIECCYILYNPYTKKQKVFWFENIVRTFFNTTEVYKSQDELYLHIILGE